jgi:hypothetical protein
MVMIHELAHFAGPTDYQPHPISDPAYIFEEGKYQLLTTTRRLENADTWAMLALELACGTHGALVEADTSSNTVPVWPRVSADSSQEPQIEMPPASNPAAPGLAFPGGFDDKGAPHPAKH